MLRKTLWNHHLGETMNDVFNPYPKAVRRTSGQVGNAFASAPLPGLREPAELVDVGRPTNRLAELLRPVARPAELADNDAFTQLLVALLRGAALTVNPPGVPMAGRPDNRDMGLFGPRLGLQARSLARTVTPMPRLPVQKQGAGASSLALLRQPPQPSYKPMQPAKPFKALPSFKSFAPALTPPLKMGGAGPKLGAPALTLQALLRRTA